MTGTDRPAASARSTRFFEKETREPLRLEPFLRSELCDAVRETGRELHGVESADAPPMTGTKGTNDASRARGGGTERGGAGCGLGHSGALFVAAFAAVATAAAATAAAAAALDGRVTGGTCTDA